MHLLTHVLQSNSTKSLHQQGPRNPAISPSQKWVNENMPVAKPFGWCSSFPLPRVSSSSCPQHPEHSLEKGCLQTPICSLITLCHVGSRPWGSRSLSPRKARLLAQGRLSSSILPTTQVCASPSQQDFYFHNFVIISGQNCEQRR